MKSVETEVTLLHCVSLLVTQTHMSALLAQVTGQLVATHSWTVGRYPTDAVTGAHTANNPHARICGFSRCFSVSHSLSQGGP